MLRINADIQQVLLDLYLGEIYFSNLMIFLMYKIWELRRVEDRSLTSRVQ